MEKKPFASFCFSTYKRPSYLKSTLKSIFLQTYTDYEVIVSDNDVEESARAVVEDFHDHRFKYFPNRENLGMKKSFNKSLERSSGSFIIMIADDDPVYPEMLETLVSLRGQYSGYGMYLGGCDWLCESPEVGRLYNFKVGYNSCLSNEHDIGYTQAFSPDAFIQDLFAFRIFPHYLWSTCIVEREILIKMGGVPEYGTPFLGDYAYLGTVASHSGCVVINKSLGCQTLHRENFGRNQNEQIAIAAKNFPEYFERKASHLKDWPEIKKLMLRFTGLWVISHMSFLHSYYKKTNDSDKHLREAETDVFRIGYMKKFRGKYFLKKNFPFLHDLLVKFKKTLGN
jgi:glycosyltransferase involved in cell wall biosynthesis